MMEVRSGGEVRGCGEAELQGRWWRGEVEVGEMAEARVTSEGDTLRHTQQRHTQQRHMHSSAMRSSAIRSSHAQQPCASLYT